MVYSAAGLVLDRFESSQYLILSLLTLLFSLFYTLVPFVSEFWPQVVAYGVMELFMGLVDTCE